MKKLYEKSEIWFAVLWIAAYVVLSSAADEASEAIGLAKSVTLALGAAMSAVLFCFIRKNGLTRKYGLCGPNVRAAAMWYYAPMAVLASVNLWGGVKLNAGALETMLYLLSMAFVGFLEEVIFRGLLFEAMRRDNLVSAVVVSSITFGIGHIVNLINGSGAELTANLLQVCYAIAIGFMLVMVYLRSGSLIPGIVMHGVFNALSIFSNEEAMAPYELTIAIALIVIAGGYALALRQKKA